jgi:DNA-binding protein YbaB
MRMRAFVGTIALLWQWLLVSCFQSTLFVVRRRGPSLVDEHNDELLCRKGSSASASRIRSPRIPSAIGAFPWFGGSDGDENNDEPDEIASASLRGVSTIMDSMSSFKSSQRVGERASAILQDLSSTIVEGTAADGKVKVSFDGNQQPIGVQIDETYLQAIKNRKEGAEELGLAMTKAMQDAHTKSGLKLEEKLKSVYADLGFEN